MKDTLNRIGEGNIQALQACIVLFYVPRIACEAIYIQTL